MYTVNRIELKSEKQPTHLLFNTEEGFDINVVYRYGIIIVSVNDEVLHKRKLTTDYKDSMMTQEDVIDYLEEYLPEELLNFSLTKIKKEK